MIAVKNNYFEKIPKFLDYHGIEYNWAKADRKQDILRVITFEILGISYFIELYANLCNLSISDFYANKMAFTELSYDTCSPSSNNALLFDDKFKIVIDPLEWHKKYMKAFKC